MNRNNRRERSDSEKTDFSRYSSYNQGRYNNSAPREMHKAVCADCGKACEVPFKPQEGRPVFCRECYGKHRPQRD